MKAKLSKTSSMPLKRGGIGMLLALALTSGSAGADDDAIASAADAAEGPADGGYEVTVDVLGLRSGEGKLLTVLCTAEKDKFPNACRLRRNVSADALPITFVGVPDGVYAFALIHDENGNDQFDMADGTPQEGVAFSNDAISPYGTPTFKDASFRVSADGSISVNMRYWQ